MSFNFLAAVTVHCSSDFGAQKNKVCHSFPCFPIYLAWSDGTGYHILAFWMLSFKKLFHSRFSLPWRGSWVPHYSILNRRLKMWGLVESNVPDGEPLYSNESLCGWEHFLLHESYWPRDQTYISCICRRILYHWVTWEAPWYSNWFWSALFLSSFGLLFIVVKMPSIKFSVRF